MACFYAWEDDDALEALLTRWHSGHLAFSTRDPCGYFLRLDTLYWNSAPFSYKCLLLHCNLSVRCWKERGNKAKVLNHGAYILSGISSTCLHTQGTHTPVLLLAPTPQTPKHWTVPVVRHPGLTDPGFPLHLAHTGVHCVCWIKMNRAASRVDFLAVPKPNLELLGARGGRGCVTVTPHLRSAWKWWLSALALLAFRATWFLAVAGPSCELQGVK